MVNLPLRLIKIDKDWCKNVRGSNSDSVCLVCFGCLSYVTKKLNKSEMGRIAQGGLDTVLALATLGSIMGSVVVSFAGNFVGSSAGSFVADIEGGFAVHLMLLKAPQYFKCS